MHKGVIVAGMHRSGTSAMTRVLNLLGCALPEDLIGANIGNEKGHWESIDLVQLNEDILSAAGTSWDDWTSVNNDWRSSRLRDDAVRKAGLLVERHCGLGPLFVMKDPRISKIADIWLDAFEKANVEPAFIIMLRSPVEVASSLERRDLMCPAYGQLLWLRYMLDAEYYSRGRKRLVCRFDSLIENWSASVESLRSGLDLFFPRNSALIHGEIDQFIDVQEYHHRSSPDLVTGNPNLSTWIRDAYAILLKWSIEGEIAADQLTLDAIRSDLDRSAPAFSRLILPGTQSGGAGAGPRLQQELQEQIAQARQASAEAASAFEDSQARIAEAHAREETLLAQIEALNAVVGELRSLQEQMEGQVAEEAAKVAELLATEADLTGRVAELEQALNEASQRQAGEEAARIAAEEQLDDLETRLATADSALIQRREELDQLWTELEAARSTLTELDALKIEKEALDARLGEANADMARLAAELDDARGAEEAARSELSEEKRARSAAEERLEVLTDHMAVMRRQQSEELELARAAQATAAAQLDARFTEITTLTQLLRETFVELDQMRVQVQTSEVRLPPQDAEVDKLSQMLHEVSTDLALAKTRAHAAETANNELTTALQRRDEEVGAAEAARSVAERQLSARFGEIATLTKLLRDASSETDRSKAHTQWLRQVNAVAAGFPFWWALMPVGWRRKREHDRYARRGLFDADKYLKLYPDVSAAGMDPLRHYILHGMDENRINPV